MILKFICRDGFRLAEEICAGLREHFPGLACFFHPEGLGQITAEDARKEYCPKCRELMRQLESPLDVTRICSEVEEIYGLASASAAEKGKSVLRGIVERIRGRR